MMETIKVNMNPNPLDVQTIHASQNDTEARQWGFELHNNGELIDTSDVTDQITFKSYEGGTEEILPTNGSTPTTSPFKGDIRYPQGLLSDQEFLYRQSPTEEDGYAKITDIKGNTLIWNQQNYDNFTDTSKWLVNDGSKYSVSVSRNVLTVTCTGAPDNNASVRISGVNSIVGHKYLLLSDVKSPKTVGFRYLYSPVASGSLGISVPADVWTQFGKVVQINSSTGFYIYFNSNNALAQGDVVEIKNHQIIDLTQMFGTTKADEIYAMEQAQSGSGIAYFKTYYPLPYYDYNQGTLLSFMGNGIKTVGKNLLNARSTYTTNGVTFTNDNGVISISGTATANAFFVTNIGLRNGSYFIGAFNDEINTKVHVAVQNKSGAYVLDGIMSAKNRVFSLNNDIDNFIIWVNSGTTLNNFVVKPMVSLVSAETFEPYTSSTLSLPVSTYFPNGMKSAGNVYDELTESKAITRIGSRSYQSGDESDTSVITDGTTTFYPLETPTETSFTTASLVTENAEIPLSNDDGVLIGKCTEELSAEPGFHDAKIKLADTDGECYSNKIQLHVERKPS